jgi:hypothetical protein
MRTALLAAAGLAVAVSGPPPREAARPPRPVVVLAAGQDRAGGASDMSWPIRRPSSAVRDSTPLPVPFAPGERLEYLVKFGIFRVGHAEMQVAGIDTIRGEPAYHVIFAVHGSALWYSLTDTLESWFSVYDLTSRRFVQNNDEDGKFYRHHYDIYPARGYFIQDDQDTLPTTAEPLDEMSFFYFTRTIPLEKGRTYEFGRYFRLDRNPVTLHVLGEVSVDVPAGRFDAIAIHPVFKSRGLFAEGGRAEVFLAADSTRIPLLIRSSVSALGHLTISLRNRSTP